MRIRNDDRNQIRVLQSIVDHAYQILGKPMMLCDLEWNILAFSKVLEGDPIWNRLYDNGKISRELIDISVNEGAPVVMTRPDKVILLESKELNLNGILGKVYDQDDLPIACVFVGSQKPFAHEDLMIVETICKKLSIELRKTSYYYNYSQKIIDACINKLIAREIVDNRYYILGNVEMIYKGLKSNLRLAVADISQCDPTYSKLGYYRELFKQTRPTFKYSIYSNQIIIILSTDANTFYPRKCFGRLNKLIEQENIRVGISGRFENIFELPKYYADAMGALHNGSKDGKKQQIFVCNAANPST